jgi:hypothetical protein
MPLKTCPNCGEKNPPRRRQCSKCETAFAFKVKKKKPKQSSVCDWRSLISGDYIKASGGPVWLDKDSNEMPMGYSGTYSVVGLDENGILALGKDKTCGFCHIWMGDETVSESGIIKRPHKVFKLHVAQ